MAAAIIVLVSVGRESGTSSCNTGTLSYRDTNKIENSNGDELGLHHTGNLLSQVAIQYTQISLTFGIEIEDEYNTPVCCEDTKQKCLIGIDCIPVARI